MISRETSHLDTVLPICEESYQQNLMTTRKRKPRILSITILVLVVVGLIVAVALAVAGALTFALAKKMEILAGVLIIVGSCMAGVLIVKLIKLLTRN